MIFSSAIFLWKFLPIVFIISFLLSRTHLNRLSNIFLLLASLFFYAWGEPRFVLVILLSIFVNWMTGICMDKYGRWRKWILRMGLVADLLILGYFKYLNFLVDIINKIAQRTLIEPTDIVLPIGISFFTFQAISYLVDVYRGQVAVQRKLVNVALYISFFPQLIAGPIVKYKDINEQIERRSITADKVADGFRRFIYGLAKKVLISNYLGLVVDTIYGRDIIGISGSMAWVAALFYMFQIYYDFSGYSDMAIGLGRMFGFDFRENFNYPYMSGSIREFWRRWHISLSTWFKEYVYIPLGGNRKGTARTYVNLCAVFFLTGLWHGANYNFILWGIYHGFFSIIERIGLEKWLKKSRILSWTYTFLVVCFGWVLFRVNDVIDALKIVKRLLLPWKYTVQNVSLWEYVDHRAIFVCICAVLGMGILIRYIPEKLKEKWRFSWIEAVFCISLLLLCFVSIASGTYNPFIYFQF